MWASGIADTLARNAEGDRQALALASPIGDRHPEPVGGDPDVDGHGQHRDRHAHLAGGRLPESWTVRNTGDSSGNVTIEGRRKDTDADDLVANVVLKAGEQQQGQHAFSPLGGAGYYWQIDCDACSWSLTLTPL